MLDYYDYTGDSAFCRERLLPMAVSILKYFDTRFKKDANGRMILDPTQVVETYVKGVINDTPTVAGLNEVPTRLCALPEALTTPEQRTFFAHMKACAPEIPMREATLEGKTVRLIAPAQKYIARTSNVENPGLYVIWPFRLLGLNRPMLEEARNTYRLKEGHLDVGWGYGRPEVEFIKKDLEQHHPGLGTGDGAVAFSNAGTSGWQAWQGLEELKDYLAANKPTVCVIGYRVMADALLECWRKEGPGRCHR